MGAGNGSIHGTGCRNGARSCSKLGGKMMTDERRLENVVNITDTLWQLNRFKLFDQIERMSGTKVPPECYELVEISFRSGAALMERAVGRH